MINPNSFRLIGHESESSGFMSSMWVNSETNSGYLFAWNTGCQIKRMILYPFPNQSRYSDLPEKDQILIGKNSCFLYI